MKTRIWMIVVGGVAVFASCFGIVQYRTGLYWKTKALEYQLVADSAIKVSEQFKSFAQQQTELYEKEKMAAEQNRLLYVSVFKGKPKTIYPEDLK